MKSIFAKALINAILVLLVGIGLLTMGLNIMYKNYMVERNMHELRRLAEVMATRMEENIDKHDLKIESLVDEITNVETYGDIKVWLLLNREHMLSSDNSMELLEYLDDEEVKEIMNAEKPIYREARFKLKDNDDYYTLIYPFDLSYYGRIAIVLNKSLPNIYKEIAEINSFSVTTISLVFFYAAFIIYFFTKHLTEEIRTLNSGVKALAKGDFNVKLSLERDDEIGELSKNLVDMARAIEEIETTRRKFVSNVSHDLRSPMTSISGYVNGMLDGTIPQDKWLHYLSIVSDESKRMIHLINEILDLAKFQNASYEVTKSEVDINQLILGILDAFERRLCEKSIDVELNFMERCKAYCDEFLIIRVISNLIDNAIKFMDEGGGLRVETKLKQTKQNQPKIIVAINNSGPVIPPDKLKTVWERFTKLDDSRGNEKTSSGLGLAIVKEILHTHGEKIDVYSDEENGTTFVFSLEQAKGQK